MITIFLLLSQLLNLSIILAWPILLIMALRRIAQIELPSSIQIAWVLIVVLIPILGGLAALIVLPKIE